MYQLQTKKMLIICWCREPGEMTKHLNSMQPTTFHNATKNAKTQRELLTKYFNEHGSVPWQNHMVV